MENIYVDQNLLEENWLSEEDIKAWEDL